MTGLSIRCHALTGLPYTTLLDATLRAARTRPAVPERAVIRRTRLLSVRAIQSTTGARVAGEPTVGTVLAKIWRSRFPDAKPAWCGALQPTAIQRSIMRPVLWVRRHAGDVARYDARATAELARQLKEGADGPFWVVVEELCVLADRLACAVRGHITGLRADRPALTNKQISEWACATVARPYRRDATLPAAAYLHAERTAYQELAVSRAARIRAFPTAEQFAERYEPIYVQLWEQRGAAALAVLTPAELGLGELPHPSMRAGANSWKVGTDRSVQHRYTLYLRTRWERRPDVTARIAGLDPDRHLSVRLRSAEPDAICRGEVERACRPIGLRCSRHHALMSSFVSGVRVADLQSAHEARRPTPGRELSDWAAVADDMPETADTGLARAVTAFARYWAARDLVAEQLAGTRMFANWPEVVERGTARRLWGRLHQREVVWEAPVVRSEAAGLVKQMFREHLRDLIRPPGAAPDEAPDDQPNGRIPLDDPRLLRTLEILHTRGVGLAEVGTRVLTETDGWMRWYLGVLGADADYCLPPAVFRDWAMHHVPDPDETAEDR